MKWDYSTTPPTAWIIEDGEPVKVDGRDIFNCAICKRWFVKKLLDDKEYCSSGCALRSAEAKVKNSK